jgi:hypothetical protein
MMPTALESISSFWTVVSGEESGSMVESRRGRDFLIVLKSSLTLAASVIFHETR